jgi:hypothetical protein
MEIKKKWYQKTVSIIALLILFFPVGLFLMWKYATWSKTVKWVVTAIVGFFVLVNATSGSNTSSTTSNSQNSAVTVTQGTDKTTQPVANVEQSQEQEVRAKSTSTPVPAQTKQPEPVSTETVSQKNAIKKAKSYLAYSAFSYQGLIAQLEYEKFSHVDAIYGADNSGGNWNDQAAKKAKSYMEYSAFSRGGSIEQLKYDKFTQAQAEYGANAVGL